MSSIAETAQLAVNLKLGTSGSFAGATSELGAVERAAASGTARTGLLQRGFGTATSAASKFEKTFSFSLTDANGHLKDANALILASADYFNNKSIPATTKAAALAKLYGRSWQDLIPLLASGSKGIAAVEEEARKFGLTLT